MKNIFYFLFFSLFITSCDSYYNRINQEYDDYKNEQKDYIQFYEKATCLSYWIWHKKGTDVLFKRIRNSKQDVSYLYLNFTIELDQEVDSIFFIKIDNKLFKLHFDQIKSTIFHTTHTSQETKIIKDKKKNEESKDDENQKIKETVIHTTETDTNNRQKIKTKFEIPKSLQQKLKSIERLSIRYYINDNAYQIDFSEKKVDKIKELFRASLVKNQPINADANSQ